MEKIQTLVKKLIDVKAVKFGDFILSSGKKSDVYVDIKLASTYPDILELITSVMVEKIATLDFDKIACIELGGVPLVVSLALKVKKPYVILRKQKKGYGIKADYIGEIEENDNFIVVEDVTTTGNSAMSVVDRLRRYNANVVAVVAVVDREEGAESRFEKFIPLLKLSQLRNATKY